MPSLEPNMLQGMYTAGPYLGIPAFEDSSLQGWTYLESVETAPQPASPAPEGTIRPRGTRNQTIELQRSNTVLSAAFQHHSKPDLADQFSKNATPGADLDGTTSMDYLDDPSSFSLVSGVGAECLVQNTTLPPGTVRPSS